MQATANLVTVRFNFVSLVDLFSIVFCFFCFEESVLCINRDGPGLGHKSRPLIHNMRYHFIYIQWVFHVTAPFYIEEINSTWLDLNKIKSNLTNNLFLTFFYRRKLCLENRLLGGNANQCVLARFEGTYVLEAILKYFFF